MHYIILQAFSAAYFKEKNTIIMLDKHTPLILVFAESLLGALFSKASPIWLVLMCQLQYTPV